MAKFMSEQKNASSTTNLDMNKYAINSYEAAGWSSPGP